eukprot:1743731-Amphidinium_carterae.1
MATQEAKIANGTEAQLFTTHAHDLCWLGRNPEAIPQNQKGLAAGHHGDLQNVAALLGFTCKAGILQ